MLIIATEAPTLALGGNLEDRTKGDEKLQFRLNRYNS
jgi:hypothetical protein